MYFGVKGEENIFGQKPVENLYADGGVVNRNPSDFGGTWAFVATDENDELLFSKSGFYQAPIGKTTNNHTELVAVLEALESMPDGWNGTLVSDSEITLGRVSKGWALKNVPSELVVRLRNVLQRLGKIKVKHVDGHPSKAQLASGIGKRGNPVSKWNVEADRLCNVEVAKVKGKV